MNELTIQDNNDGFLVTNTLQEALQVADIIAKSSFCPKQFIGKPGDILVCMQMGKEVGLKPMQALQNIAVINGKPSLWGDAMLAVCRQASNFEYVDETFDETTMTATCKAKRHNEPEVVRTFSKDDAVKANLWGKQGPWISYPTRMLAMRARGFCLRDAFADALRGIISAEEASDYPKKEHVKVTNNVVDMATYSEPLESRPALISEEELELLMGMMKQAGSDVGEVCKHMKISSLHFVTKDILPKMLEKLDDKINSLKQADVPRETIVEGKMNPEVAGFFEGAE